MRTFSGLVGVWTSTLLFLYLSVTCQSCDPPTNGHAMFHRHRDGSKFKYTINTCQPCGRHHVQPNSPLEICQFRHMLNKINKTTELFREAARQFEEEFSPADESTCRAHNGYEQPIESDSLDALIDSYQLLTTVTLNMTIIGRYPGSVEDTSNLQIRLHHLLCEIKFLLHREQLDDSVYKQELYLPSDLSLENRIVFTCRNYHQAVNALEFIHAYIWRSLTS